MELFALVEAASGEDYGHYAYDYTPEPSLIGLFKTKEEAKKAMLEQVEYEIEQCDEDEEVEVDDTSEDYRVITNKDADYCIVLKVQSVLL